MALFESEKVEFKLQVTDDLYKEVIAFANTMGGTIYVGIDDNGNVVGVNNIDETSNRITNGIRDSIHPDITMFVKYTLQEDSVIRINVSEGTYKPYYLKSKGLKPTGVFIRQGTSIAPASPEQIRQMIKNTDGDVFEEMRSIEQELSFNDAKKDFALRDIAFDESKYVALGLRNIYDNSYTNLALILSDQCPYTTKVAIFGDDDNTALKITKEFSGSIFKQLNEAYSFISLANNTRSDIQGLYRIDKKDYPDEVLREALLNSLIHRDYSFSGSVIININDSNMEFISLGGLVPGLSPEDIRAGISQPRNKNLAAIFHRLKLIESYGTGIRKIFKNYKDLAYEPRILTTPNTFKLVVPNMNKTLRVSESKDATNVYLPVTPQMKAVLKYLEEHKEIRDDELQKLLGIKKTRAYLLVKQMEKYNLISTIGRGAHKYYVMKDK
ncbi:MAG: putative DNA binding domain-containing protein [Phascolarctobacterium sp.]|nr:putative DNA binding domain-containing protein [Phascolarctobacterium sp.]